MSGEVRIDDAATGDRYATLIVTNQSGESCVLNGTGDLQLIGSDQKDLPTDVRDVLKPEARPITVRPGEDAGLKLHWVVVPVGNEPVTEPCQPTPVSVAVTPPDGTRTFSVPWAYGPVCWHGRIQASAYMPLEPA